jgi:CelD/BcsL family acetyltransferase involved in cellulose biosynthesis
LTVEAAQARTSSVLAREQTVETTKPAGAITIQVITEFVALRELGAEWRSLVARCDASSIFQTFEWNYAWWESFGDKHRLLVLLARADGCLVGIAPLMIAERRAHGLRRHSIEFIGTGVSDYLDFIVAPVTKRW